MSQIACRRRVTADVAARKTCGCADLFDDDVSGNFRVCVGGRFAINCRPDGAERNVGGP